MQYLCTNICWHCLHKNFITSAKIDTERNSHGKSVLQTEKNECKLKLNKLNTATGKTTMDDGRQQRATTIYIPFTVNGWYILKQVQSFVSSYLLSLYAKGKGGLETSVFKWQIFMEISWQLDRQTGTLTLSEEEFYINIVGRIMRMKQLICKYFLPVMGSPTQLELY